VELTEHEFFRGFVVAEKPEVLVRFTFRILSLRRIDAFVRLLNKAIVQGEGIGALSLAMAWFAVRLAFPMADKGTERSPGIGLCLRGRRLGPEEHKGCTEEGDEARERSWSCQFADFHGGMMPHSLSLGM
jgi:hypothetical protein